MKLVAQVKLLPSPQQKEALKKTLEAANQAANRVSEFAFAQKVFKRFDLHYALYDKVREDTNLTAQAVALLFAKVADAYKLDRLTQRTFRPHGAISYGRVNIIYKKTRAAKTSNILIQSGKGFCFFLDISY